MIKLQFIGEEVIDELDAAHLRLADRRLLMRAVTRSAELVRRQAILNTTTVFANPTGNLGKGIMVDANESQLSADIGPHVIYGRIQELGGTIRPVHAKMLAIPIGTMKGAPRHRRNAGTPLHIRRINGKIFLFDAQGMAQYVLKDFVVLKPHPYLRPALVSQQDNIAADFDRTLRQVFGVTR
jgi:hypothetical protein